MKQELLREKKHEREKNLAILEDMGVINALLIMLLSLIFLIDIARYQWMLMIILVLGFFLNLTLTVCGFLRKKWIFCGGGALVTLVLSGSLIYLLI